MANQKYDAFLTVARLGSFKAAAEEWTVVRDTHEARPASATW